MTRTTILFALVVAGCGTPNPCTDNPALCQNAGQGTCTGQCAPLPSNTNYRALVWSGPEGTTPPKCPSVASAAYETGYLDTPPSTFTCGPCTCSPSSNLCLPSGTMSANAAACPAGDAGAPFDAPEVWDGTCSAMNPVSSADSVTVDPPGFAEVGQCAPAYSGTVEFSGGKTIALDCTSLYPPSNDVPGVCPNLGDVCTFPDVPGFSVCTLTDADAPCPAGWPMKRLYFPQTRQCRCSCGTVTGEVCSATVTAYQDNTCSHPLGSVVATSDQPTACLDVGAGSALGSKSAVVNYRSGTCTPTLMKIQPSTLCCLP